MKRLMLVCMMILCLVPLGAWADLDYLQEWEETAAEDRAPFDAVAAFSGRWWLDSVEYDDGSIMSRQELRDIGYDEAVTFTVDGDFNVVIWRYGSVSRSESRAWELTGANFVTLDGTIMLPFGFRDGQLVLIKSDGQYFYTADTGEISDPEPAPIDERLLGSWAIESMSSLDGSIALDHDMLDSIGYYGTTEFTEDHRWIDTFWEEDGTVRDTQLSWYAIGEPGIIHADGDAYPYTVDGDQFSMTDTYNGLVWGYRRITDEGETQAEETGPAETP